MERLLTLHSPISRLELLWHKGLKETEEEEQTAQLKHKPGPACCSGATLCKGHWLPLVLVMNIAPPLFSRSQLEIRIWSAHCSWGTFRTSSRKMQECDTNPLPPSSRYKAAHVMNVTPLQLWEPGASSGVNSHAAPKSNGNLAAGKALGAIQWQFEVENCSLKEKKMKSAFTALWLHWAFSFWSPAGCCVMPSPN